MFSNVQQLIKQRPASQIVPLALATVAILFTLTLTWQLLGAKSAMRNSKTQVNNSGLAISDRPSYNTDVITEANLFGSLEERTDVDIEDIDAPETRLKLQLRGAFSSAREGYGSAIIESDDKPAQTYKVGDNINPSVVLRGVYQDRVLLSRQGQLETLYFPLAQQLLETANNSNENQAARQGSDKGSDGENFIARTGSSKLSEQQKEMIKARLKKLTMRRHSE